MAYYDITALGASAYEFDSNNGDYVRCRVNPYVSNRFTVEWIGTGAVRYIQSMDINPTTGAVTQIGSPLNIAGLGATSYTQDHRYIDASNLMCSGSSGGLRLYSVAGNGVITANGAAVSIADTAVTNGSNGLLILDSTHAVSTFVQSNAAQRIRAASFDTATQTITGLGSSVAGVGGTTTWMALTQLTSTKFLYSATSSSLFKGIVYSVDGSYNLSTVGSLVAFNSGGAPTGGDAVMMDTTSDPMVGVAISVTAGYFYLQGFRINTSTWAITTFGTPLTSVASPIAPQFGGSMIVKLDNTHVAWGGSGTNNYPYLYNASFDQSTGNFVNLNSAAGNNNTVGTNRPAPIDQVSRGKIVQVFKGESNDGYLRGYDVSLPPLYRARTPIPGGTQALTL